MSLLVVDGVTSGYSEVKVLWHVSVKVDEREVVTIIGPNGAGKSTLMKTIVGLLHPMEGRILLNGQEISRKPAHEIVRHGACYVPQVANVFTSLTVEENLEMGAFLLEPAELKARKEKVYEIFPRLRERRGQLAGKMSGGERQMVAMGSALMLDPRLLLLDEPSAGLSPRFVEEVFQRIGRINEAGVAIMMVEQNARRSLEMAHRGYVLAAGRKRYEGAARQMLNNPEIAKLYLGG